MKEDRSFCWINSIWRGKYIGALDLWGVWGAHDAIKLEVTVERKGNVVHLQIGILPFLKKTAEKLRKNSFIFMFKDSEKRGYLRTVKRLLKGKSWLYYYKWPQWRSKSKNFCGNINASIINQPFERRCVLKNLRKVA